MGKLLARIVTTAVLAASAFPVFAQDIHFTQFDASPLTINPAFTGMFDGQFRACGIYRNQWKSVTVPYVTFGASIDMPLLIEKNGDYLASGLQVFKDQAGDGNLSNTTAMVSLAYHKFFGTQHVTKTIHQSDFAVGFQAGYTQKSVDLSRIYFGDELFGRTFVPGTSSLYQLGLGSSISYFLVNAGLCFSHSVSNSFNFTIGLGANNLNQPDDAIMRDANSQKGLDMRYTGQLGANFIATQRLTFRPAVLYQMQSSAVEFIGGNEFHYAMGDHPEYDNFSTAVFAGLWYRTGDAMMVTAGFETKGVRVGFSYDYNVSELNRSSAGNGGYEISIRYIMPRPLLFAPNRTIPCGRF